MLQVQKDVMQPIQWAASNWNPVGRKEEIEEEKRWLIVEHTET